MSKCWVYHKTKEPMIIGSDEFDDYFKKGWKDSPANFMKLDDYGVDKNDPLAVDAMGRTVDKIKDVANGALNLESMKAKELDAYAMDSFGEKLKGKTKPAKIAEIKGMM